MHRFLFTFLTIFFGLLKVQVSSNMVWRESLSKVAISCVIYHLSAHRIPGFPTPCVWWSTVFWESIHHSPQVVRSWGLGLWAFLWVLDEITFLPIIFWPPWPVRWMWDTQKASKNINYRPDPSTPSFRCNLLQHLHQRSLKRVSPLWVGWRSDSVDSRLVENEHSPKMGLDMVGYG